MTDIEDMLKDIYFFDGIIEIDVKELFYKNGNLIPKEGFRHPKNGKFKAYTKQGYLYLEINYKNNKKNGEANCYFKDSCALSWTNCYKNDELNGVCKKYRKNGNFEKTETFVMGKKEGLEKEYDEQGNIKKEITWKQNARHGFARYYYSNGQIECELQYVNDKAEGVAKTYFETGELKTMALFSDNEIQGCKRGYFKNGKLKNEGYYKKGKCEGLYKRFYENGKIKEIFEYKNDKLHGKVQGFYENGDLKFEHSYKNDLRNGYSIYYKKQTKEIITKCFYKNGEFIDHISDNGIIGKRGISASEYKYSIENIKLESKNPNAWVDKNLIFPIITNKKHSAYAILLFNKKTKEPPIIVDKNTEKCAKEELINYASINNYIVEDDKLLDDLLRLEFEESIPSELYHKTAEMLADIVKLNKSGIKHVMMLKKVISDKNDKKSEKEDKTKEIEIKKKNLKKKYNYNLDFVNCPRDVKFLTEKIVKSKKLNFSICIYGEPGTGKSAYAEFLARKLGLDFVKISAADILGGYVGDSEQKIKQAFDEAKEKGAMLIIDEVDSFLYSRGQAKRSWEITLVNQMLTSMENFNYPFICTTNFIDILDQASLRRFTFKLKFGFLKKDKIKSAFKYIFAKNPNSAILEMNGLTVSDFASVKKECDILNIEDIAEIAKMLEEIVSLKKSEELRTNIGFN